MQSFCYWPSTRSREDGSMVIETKTKKGASPSKERPLFLGFRYGLLDHALAGQEPRNVLIRHVDVVPLLAPVNNLEVQLQRIVLLQDSQHPTGRGIAGIQCRAFARDVRTSVSISLICRRLRHGGVHAVSYTHLTLPTSDLV